MISYIIGRYLVKVKYISLVNLILNKMAVVELIQEKWNEEDLDKEFKKICFDDNYREEMMFNYSTLKACLGNAGASRNIAKSIVDATMAKQENNTLYI
jgi:lipid-A-disaccharide synthase